MRRVAAGQLSFDVAPKGKRPPVTAAISLSGTFSAAAITTDAGMPQLGHGEQVVVQVVEQGSGELICESVGIVAVAFVDKQLDGELVTIRHQKIKV